MLTIGQSNLDESEISQKCVFVYQHKFIAPYSGTWHSKYKH